MESWLDNHSIGAAGVKAIVIFGASIGALGVVAGAWEVTKGDYEGTVLLTFLGLMFGVLFGVNSYRDLRKKNYFSRQMSYLCRSNPRPYDAVDSFIRHFFLQIKLDITREETPRTSNYYAAGRELRAFVARDGKAVVLFGLNDADGKRGEILDLFKAEAIRTLGLNDATRYEPKFGETKDIPPSPLDFPDGKVPALLLEEPVEYFKIRTLALVVVGWAMTICGAVSFGFGIAGRFLHLPYEYYCFTAATVVGGPLMAVGILMSRVRRQYRPMKIYENGIMDRRSPSSWETTGRFYPFNDLKQITYIPAPINPHIKLEFNGSKELLLVASMPGIAGILDHIKRNYPQVKFPESSPESYV